MSSSAPKTPAAKKIEAQSEKPSVPESRDAGGWLKQLDQDGNKIDAAFILIWFVQTAGDRNDAKSSWIKSILE